MKKLSIILITMLLSACAASIPQPPEPEGRYVPANPPTVKLSELEV